MTLIKKINPYFFIGMGAALVLSVLMLALAMAHYGGPINRYEYYMYVVYPLIFFSAAAIILGAYGLLTPRRVAPAPYTARRRFRSIGATLMGAVFLFNVFTKGILNLDGKIPQDVCEDVVVAFGGFLFGCLVFFLVGFTFRQPPAKGR